MCGLYGGLSWGPPLDAADLARMGEAIRHRGPDDADLYNSESGDVALGHRRLSIIDLSNRGRQPMWNERRTVGLVFNGEIYNFRDLRASLERDGHRFRSDTDSEVILHGYEEYGEDVFDKLDGMFAFALWDAARRQLLMVRDRLGKKPLYFWRGNKLLLFASELKALLAHREVSRTLNPLAVADYLTLGYVPSPHTMFAGAKKVRPGELIAVTRSGDLSSHRYWRLPALGSIRPDRRQAIDTIRALVTQSVKKRLVADVPVGAFLSGGIDSTVVVGLIKELTGRTPQTFTVGFEAGSSTDKVNEDLHRARSTSSRLKTEHAELIVGGATDFARLLNLSVWHVDEPNANPTVLSTLAVSEFARSKGVKVVLTGDGGDELFAGYRRYLFDLYAERAGHVPRAVRRAGASVLSRVSSRQAQSVSRFLNKTLDLDDASLSARYLQWRRQFQLSEQMQLLAPDLSEAAATNSSEALLSLHLDAFPDASSQDRLSYADLHLWVADDSNTRVDRATMACSLEARCPLLDRAVVEYAMAIPVQSKIVRGETKYLLKEAFADLIPEEILRGRKKGFSSPARWWLNTHLASHVDAVLAPDRLRQTGILDPAGVESLRRSGTWKRVPLKLWSLMMLQLWSERFLGASARS